MTKRTTSVEGATGGAAGARPRGRPPKLTRALLESLCADLQTGAPVTECASANFINRDTYYDWVARGKADLAEGRDTLYAEFAERAPAAISRGHVDYCHVIHEAAMSARGPKPARPAVVAAKVQAAKVAKGWLGMRFAKRYRLPPRTSSAAEAPEEAQLPAAGETQRRHDFSKLTSEQRRQLAELMRLARVEEES